MIRASFGSYTFTNDDGVLLIEDGNSQQRLTLMETGALAAFINENWDIRDYERRPYSPPTVVSTQTGINRSFGNDAACPHCDDGCPSEFIHNGYCDCECHGLRDPDAHI